MIRRTVVRANRSGQFSLRVRLTRVGRVVIKATGSRSGKSARVVVMVRKRHGHGGWDLRPAAVTTGLGTGSAGPATATATRTSGDQGLAVAGLGVLALLGGAVITARRRRGMHAG